MNTKDCLKYIEAQEKLEKFRAEAEKVLKKIFNETGITGQMGSFMWAFRKFNFDRCRKVLEKLPVGNHKRLSEFLVNSETVVKNITAGCEEFKGCSDLYRIVKELGPEDIKRFSTFLKTFFELKEEQQKMISKESFKEKPMDEILKYAADVTRAIQNGMITKALVKEISDQQMRQIIRNLSELNPK